MICPRSAVKCVQSTATAEYVLCEARTCDQSCSRGFGSATCSSMVKTCNQQGERGRYNMTCAPGVESCTQTLTAGLGIMRCDADMCKQNCTNSQCHMICPASVKECHQICNAGATCLLMISCEADSCKSDCPAKVVSSGCTFLNMKNDAAPAINLSVSCFMFLPSFVFMIECV